MTGKMVIRINHSCIKIDFKNPNNGDRRLRNSMNGRELFGSWYYIHCIIIYY